MENEGNGPTVRVHMGTSEKRPSGELRIDPAWSFDDEALARRAEILRCQREHLSAGLGGTCIMLDCPFELDECPQVATDWLLAHRSDEHLMSELAADPTLGHDPRLITSLIKSERFWMRIARAVPVLRSMAFAHMRGFELIVHREEVFRLAFETGTPLAYEGLLRMLRITGLPVPGHLRPELREHLVSDGIALDEWEDLLEPDDPA